MRSLKHTIITAGLLFISCLALADSKAAQFINVDSVMSGELMQRMARFENSFVVYDNQKALTLNFTPTTRFVDSSGKLYFDLRGDDSILEALGFKNEKPSQNHRIALQGSFLFPCSIRWFEIEKASRAKLMKEVIEPIMTLYSQWLTQQVEFYRDLPENYKIQISAHNENNNSPFIKLPSDFLDSLEPSLRRHFRLQKPNEDFTTVSCEQ